MGPCRMTRKTSREAAISVAKLMPALSSAAQRRAPNRPNRMDPSNGRPRTSNISTSLLLERFQVMQVEAVELLPDLEEKDAENEHTNQHVERDAAFDDH